MEKKNQSRITILALVIGVALIAVALFIVFGNGGSTAVAPDAYADIPQSVTEDGAHVLGNPDAPITLVEFADFLCPHCQAYRHDVIDPFIKEYVRTGKAKLEYRMFLTVDRTAITPRLLECAVEQNENIFWAGHDTLFNLAENGWTNESSREFATLLDLDYGKILDCIPEADQFSTDVQLGQSLGVASTPTTLLRTADGDITNIAGVERGGAPYSTIAAIVEASQ